MSPARKSATQDRTTAAVASWARFTFLGCGHRLGRVPFVAVNWAVLAVLVAAAWLIGPRYPLPVAGAFLVAVVASAIRAARTIPAHEATLRSVYTTCGRTFGLPTLSRTSPIPDPNALRIRTWHKGGVPSTGTIATRPGSKADDTTTRPAAEQTLIRALPAVEGRSWIVDWGKAGQAQFELVDDNDPRITQQRTRATITRTVVANLPRAVKDVEVAVEWDDTADTADVPARIDITYSAGTLLTLDDHSRFEGAFDAQVQRGGRTWIYEWDLASLTITAVAPDSVEARTKELRNNLLRTITARAKTTFGVRNAGQVDVDIIDWVEEGVLPHTIKVTFSNATLQTEGCIKLVEMLDQDLAYPWPKIVWLEDWAMTVPATLTLTAAENTNQMALRKAEEKKLRGVATEKFKVPRNSPPVNVEVLQWRSVYEWADDETNLTPETGTLVAEKPTEVVISFGTLDVNDYNFQLAAERALDALYPENGWRYKWRPASGDCELVEVPQLPRAALFPSPGTDEFIRMEESALRGRILYGPAKGGGDALTDFDAVPHSLVGGTTGAGKALADDTLIPTPDGMVQMRDLCVGDRVFDEKGQPCRVTGVHPQPAGRSCYKVTFSDGSTIVADAEHLWFTEDRAARLSRFHDGRDRERRRRLAPPVVARLRAAAAEATADDTITVPDAARLAGRSTTDGWVHEVARQVGPAGIVQPVVRTYRYDGSTYLQSQKVSVWHAGQVRDRLGRCEAAGFVGRRSATLAALDAVVAAGDGAVTMTQLRTLTGGTPNQLRGWLSGVSPAGCVTMKVPLAAPAKTVTRAAAPVTLYPKAALLGRLADMGDDILHDQRHLRAVGAVRTTAQIADTLHTADGHVNHSVPVAEPLCLPHVDVPVPPYVLGAWLGDGHSWHAELTTADPQMVTLMRAEGVTLTPRVSRYAYGMTLDGAEYGALRSRLRNLGVLQNKHIPACYLRASIEQRRALLAGLLDTDGTVDPGGAVSYTSVLPQLARDVFDLAAGLGYRPTITSRVPRIGEKECRVAYKVSFTTDEPVFRLERKRFAQEQRTVRHNRERTASRYIVAVEPVAEVPMRCITVDSASRLFLAGESMIPTHNSVFLRIMLFWGLWYPDMYDMIVCDPKQTDFTWTAQYPNVTFASTTEEIAAAVKLAHQRMTENQQLLKETAVEKVGVLYDMAAEGKFDRARLPRRTVLFFDEMAAYLNPSTNEEVVVLQKESRALLEQIMMLGRAPWTNTFGAAQKPTAQNLGTQIRELMGNKVGIGWMKSNMSEQVLGSNLASLLDRSETPKGRGWILTEGEPDKLFQTLYLPLRTEKIKWLPGEPTVEGLQDMIAVRLTELGYRLIHTTDGGGAPKPKWVRTDVAIEPDDEPAGAPAGRVSHAEVATSADAADILASVPGLLRDAQTGQAPEPVDADGLFDRWETPTVGAAERVEPVRAPAAQVVRPNRPVAPPAGPGAGGRRPAASSAPAATPATKPAGGVGNPWASFGGPVKGPDDDLRALMEEPPGGNGDD